LEDSSDLPIAPKLLFVESESSRGVNFAETGWYGGRFCECVVDSLEGIESSKKPKGDEGEEDEEGLEEGRGGRFGGSDGGVGSLRGNDILNSASAYFVMKRARLANQVG